MVSPDNPHYRDALKVAVCEYLLSVNLGYDVPFIPPTAINWLGDGIVSAVLAEPTTADSRALMTDLEHEAMEVSGRLANLLHEIIGVGPQSQQDWHEAAQRIHAIQHMILAQAAARAYPHRYRLLGRSGVRDG